MPKKNQKLSNKEKQQVLAIANSVSNKKAKFRNRPQGFPQRKLANLVSDAMGTAIRQSTRTTRKNGHQLMSMVSTAKTAATLKYVATVLDPQFAPPSRIPTNFGYPSSVIKLEYEVMITPNASGNFCAILNAGAGNSTTTDYKFLQLFNADWYTSANNYGSTSATTASNGHFSYTDKLKATDVSKLRVVGASMRAYFVGNYQDASGYFVSAFLPHPVIRGVLPSGVTGTATSYAIYSGYSEENLKNEYYNSTYPVGSPAESIWIPRDDTDLDYVNHGTLKETSQCVISGFGLPNKSCVKLGITIHMEYIPTVTNWISDQQTVQADPRAMAIVGNMRHTNPQYFTSPASNKSLSSALGTPAITDNTDAETIFGWMKEKAGNLLGYAGSRVATGALRGAAKYLAPAPARLAIEAMSAYDLD
jgi:hypothetical protein